jgi:hypothetical protein
MVALSTYLITFRLLHILGAIAWGGAIFVMVFFIQPTAKAIGPTAGPFMRELLSRRKIVTVVLWIALTTIVSGGFLYWHDWRAFGSYGRFIKSRYGLALTLGAISALAAFLIGLFGTKPTIDRTFALGAQIASVGDQPPPALVGQLQAMQERGRTLAKLNLTFVALAALFMATARYW